jgi:hypothetical protein
MKGEREIDWRKPNVLIADELGLSNTRVQQLRREANAPVPMFRHVNLEQARSYWTLFARADEIRGRNVEQLPEDLRELVGGITSRARRFARQVCGLVAHRHPWTQMNFDLPDKVLEEIWGVSNRVIRQYRIRHGKPLPKWGKRGDANGVMHSTEFLAAVECERQKVCAFEVMIRRFQKSDEERVATFSACEQYRYTLEILWDSSKPWCQFIGLNPSTATEAVDDPTVRRCKAFAHRFGCGGLLMTNLFALRSTDPAFMLKHHNPVGEHAGRSSCRNTLAIKEASARADMCIAAWGSHGMHLDRGAKVLELLKRVQCLGLTKAGFPRHPLYLRKDAELVYLTLCSGRLYVTPNTFTCDTKKPPANASVFAQEPM